MQEMSFALGHPGNTADDDVDGVDGSMMLALVSAFEKCATGEQLTYEGFCEAVWNQTGDDRMKDARPLMCLKRHDQRDLWIACAGSLDATVSTRHAAAFFLLAESTILGPEHSQGEGCHCPRGSSSSMLDGLDAATRKPANGLMHSVLGGDVNYEAWPAHPHDFGVFLRGNAAVTPPQDALGSHPRWKGTEPESCRGDFAKTSLVFASDSSFEDLPTHPSPDFSSQLASIVKTLDGVVSWERRALCGSPLVHRKECLHGVFSRNCRTISRDKQSLNTGPVFITCDMNDSCQLPQDAGGGTEGNHLEEKHRQILGHPQSQRIHSASDTAGDENQDVSGDMGELSTPRERSPPYPIPPMPCCSASSPFMAASCNTDESSPFAGKRNLLSAFFAKPFGYAQVSPRTACRVPLKCSQIPLGSLGPKTYCEALVATDRLRSQWLDRSDSEDSLEFLQTHQRPAPSLWNRQPVSNPRRRGSLQAPSVPVTAPRRVDGGSDIKAALWRPGRSMILEITNEARSARLVAARSLVQEEKAAWRNTKHEVFGKLQDAQEKLALEQHKRRQLVEGMRHQHQRDHTIERQSEESRHALHSLVEAVDFRVSLLSGLITKFTMGLPFWTLRLHASMMRRCRTTAISEISLMHRSLKQCGIMAFRGNALWYRQARHDATCRAKKHVLVFKNLCLTSWADLSAFKFHLYRFASSTKASSRKFTLTKCFLHWRCEAISSCLNRILFQACFKCIPSCSVTNLAFCAWWRLAREKYVIRCQLLTHKSAKQSTRIPAAFHVTYDGLKNRISFYLRSSVPGLASDIDFLRAKLASATTALSSQIAGGFTAPRRIETMDRNMCTSKDSSGIQSQGWTTFQVQRAQLRRTKPRITDLARQVGSRRLLKLCLSLWSEERYVGACERLFAARRLRIFSQVWFQTLSSFTFDIRKLQTRWKSVCDLRLKHSVLSLISKLCVVTRHGKMVMQKLVIRGWLDGIRVLAHDLDLQSLSLRRARHQMIIWKHWASFSRRRASIRTNVNLFVERNSKNLVAKIVAVLYNHAQYRGKFESMRCKSVRMTSVRLSMHSLGVWRDYVRNRHLLVGVFSRAEKLWEQAHPQESCVYATMFQSMLCAFGKWLQHFNQYRWAKQQDIMSKSASTFFTLRATASSIARWYLYTLEAARSRDFLVAILTRHSRRSFEAWAYQTAENLGHVRDQRHKIGMLMLGRPTFNVLRANVFISQRIRHKLSRMFLDWRRATADAIYPGLIQHRKRKLIEHFFCKFRDMICRADLRMPVLDYSLLRSWCTWQEAHLIQVQKNIRTSMSSSFARRRILFWAFCKFHKALNKMSGMQECIGMIHCDRNLDLCVKAAWQRETREVVKSRLSRAFLAWLKETNNNIGQYLRADCLVRSFRVAASCRETQVKADLQTTSQGKVTLIRPKSYSSSSVLRNIDNIKHIGTSFQAKGTSRKQILAEEFPVKQYVGDVRKKENIVGPREPSTLKCGGRALLMNDPMRVGDTLAKLAPGHSSGAMKTGGHVQKASDTAFRQRNGTNAVPLLSKRNQSIRTSSPAVLQR